MEKRNYTVLGRGEAYREVVEVGRGFGKKKPLRSFEQAAELLLPQVHRTLAAAEEIPRMAKLDEVVVEVRMHRDFIAKSYLPRELLDNAHFTMRGSGRWLQKVQNRTAETDKSEPVTVESRALFVSGRPESVQLLVTALQGRWGGKGVRSEVTRIEEIRLPQPQERLRGALRTATNADVAIELVLFQWDRVRRDEAIRRIARLTTGDNLRARPYVDGPTFIAAIVPTAALRELGDYNYLRAARPLPRVDLTRTAAGVPVSAPGVPPQQAPEAWMAVFDGGFSLPHPHLDGYVIAQDETPEPPRPTLIEHGTAVCSAALYGAIAPGKPLRSPSVGVRAYRVLPDSKDLFELYGVIDALERVVPALPNDVKVVNLSLGPPGPIDDAPSRFTYALDRLAYETERLFFVSVGNWGDMPGQERIQAPSDAVNAIGVGAWEVEPTSGAISPATYSCIGPGRSGCAVKPDGLAQGGSAAAPFYVVDVTAGSLVGTFGTSYSTPLATATTAQLLARSTPKISTQGARALLLNACSPIPSVDGRAGWGLLPADPQQIIESDRNRVAVLYEDVLTPRVSWKLPFFIPAGLMLEGNVQFGWTVVFAPDVDANNYDEYTMGGLELQFRSNIRVYSYTHPTKRNVFEKLHDTNDAARIAELLASGWTRGVQPTADSRRTKDERTLRATEAKWDTVIRGRVGKNAASIDQPFLTLSMLGRGDWDRTDPNIQARFGAVLNVFAPKYRGNLYEQVTQAFSKLRPLQVHVPAVVQVNTTGIP